MGDFRLAPVIAIVGCDGSGKTTVSESLISWLREHGPAEICHLGKQSGNIRRAIHSTPLIGGIAQRVISSQSRQSREDWNPGLLAILTILAFSLRRARRFRRMLTYRRKGITVIADRYPQADLPSRSDGPGLFNVRPRNAFIRAITEKERDLFAWMTSHRPDVVIRLNVDLQTAYARKPDHKYESLKNKIAALHEMSFGGAVIVDIDSTLPLVQVIDQAKTAITRALTVTGRAPGDHGSAAQLPSARNL